MASPGITRGAFDEMTRNAAELSQAMREYQQDMGVINATNKTNAFESKTSMTSMNDTADLVSQPLNQSYKSS